MGIAVVSGASCVCTMGTAPGQITPTNQPTVRIGGKPAASIADADPAVAAATAAAMGVLTPQPCVPAPAGGWICPGKVRVGGKPILTSDGKLTCSYGGSISITNPGQVAVKTQ